MLPNERKAAGDIRTALAHDLDVCYMVLRYCVVMLTQENLLNPGKDVKYVAYFLYVNACKELRSILALCEIGQAEEASKLLRSMFETEMAINFLLRKKANLFEYKDKKRTQVKPPRHLTCRNRALLLMARFFVEECEFIESIQRQHKSRPLKRLAAVHADYQSRVAKILAVIDPKKEFWQGRLKVSFSGLSPRALADSLGRRYRKFHEYLYGHLSNIAHGNSFISHVQRVGPKGVAPQWQNDIGAVQRTMRLGTTMLFNCAKDMHRRFNFGKSAEAEMQLVEAAFGSIVLKG